MHSNFITPPDFVNEELHTVTVVDPSDDDVQLLIRMCQNSDEMYNIYLYSSDMLDKNWLEKSINQSDAVIVNLDCTEQQWLCGLEKVFYYSQNNYIIPAKKVDNVLHYFSNRINSL